MGKTKHEKSFVNFEQGYEQNVVGLKGIVYFGVGIFLLIVVSFGLMWILQNVLEDNAASNDKKDIWERKDKERLPPEPRLQAAPGFEVQSDKGPINLELKAPQSEYREMRKQWEDQWANGQKDEKTGTVVTMNINDAKAKFLQQNAGSGQPTNDALDKSRMYISDSSAGRLASEKRR